MVLNRNSTAMDEFRETLRKYSLKATSQRLAVHSAMMELGHASADMVAEEIYRQAGARISVASVYNILSQFALVGIYSHLLSSNSKMFFDFNTFKHMHLYDKVNHTFKDVLDDELVDMVESRLKNRRFRGFKVDGVDILLVCHPTAKKTVK